MAIKIKSTKTIATDGIKVFVYGKAGIGKTTLMGTAPDPIVLSCESGLLALKDKDIPYIEINDVQDIYDAKEYLTVGEGAGQYKTICLDSITEIAEVMLTALKKVERDARQAYGKLADEMNSLIREFRDIKGVNVVFSAKQIRVTDDDTGLTSYMAAMPGKNLVNALPFLFDEVLYMTLKQDDEGREHRVIKTAAEWGHDAKDRSGKLNYIERPDLTHIFNKINGGVAPKQEKVEKVEKKEDKMFFWIHPESDSAGVATREEFNEMMNQEPLVEEVTEEQYKAFLENQAESA